MINYYIEYKSFKYLGYNGEKGNRTIVLYTVRVTRFKDIYEFSNNQARAGLSIPEALGKLSRYRRPPPNLRLKTKKKKVITPSNS